MSTEKLVHVHGESVRIGIHLAALFYTNARQPVDMVSRIANSRAQHVIMNEFPLETLAKSVQERQERRRTCAQRAMEVLLARSGEPELLTRSKLEHIAAQAYQLAAAMESEESVSASIDSLDPSKQP